VRAAVCARAIGSPPALQAPALATMAGVLRIPVIRLDPDLPLPAYARTGDAGADLVARDGVVLRRGGGRALVATGVALALPDGYAGFVQPRSGLALRHGVTCLNTPGLIDSGYRDELRVLLVNTDPEADYEVHRGDRVAQLVIQRVEYARFDQVEELDPSERGTGGFGHTGR
jgi:dUTP pyrophosphatase